MVAQQARGLCCCRVGRCQLSAAVGPQRCPQTDSPLILDIQAGSTDKKHTFQDHKTFLLILLFLQRFLLPPMVKNALFD